MHANSASAHLDGILDPLGLRLAAFDDKRRAHERQRAATKCAMPR
jgi:hypothetical protein